MQLLKGHIKEHWTPEASKFREPLIEDAEKAAIRASLPAGLADANSKIRTAVGMAVAAIAKWDVPEEWPTLVPDLLRAISEPNNSTLGALHGELHSESLHAGVLEGAHMPRL